MAENYISQSYNWATGNTITAARLNANVSALVSGLSDGTKAVNINKLLVGAQAILTLSSTDINVTNLNTVSMKNDLTIAKPSNDGNPKLILGASAAESLFLTSKYASGTQTLEKVTFTTNTASGTENYGQFVFSVDEVETVKFSDALVTITGGLNLSSDLAINTNKFNVTASSGNTTIAGTLGVTGNITGTLATAAQTNITSVGTLSGLTVTAKITGSISGNCDGNAATATNVAGTGLTGNTLASGITASSLTSVGTLTGLTIGGTLALGTNSITMTGSIGSTGARVTKLWATDITCTNNISSGLTGNVTGNVTGNLTGNVTGNTSGSSGSCTGNAATATNVAGTGLTGNTLASGITASSLTSVGTLTGLTVTAKITGSISGNCDGSSGSCTGNAATATNVAASGLTGNTLASGVTASSLTSVGTLSGLTVTAKITGSISGNCDGSSGSCTGNAATASAVAASALTGATLAGGITASSLTSVGTLTGLTIGGTLALGTNSITMTGSIGSIGARVTKLWATDIACANNVSISGSIMSISNMGTDTVSSNSDYGITIDTGGTTATNNGTPSDWTAIYNGFIVMSGIKSGGVNRSWVRCYVKTYSGTAIQTIQQEIGNNSDYGLSITVPISKNYKYSFTCGCSGNSLIWNMTSYILLG